MRGASTTHDSEYILTGTGGAYQGLLLMPSPGWAVQIGTEAGHYTDKTGNIGYYQEPWPRQRLAGKLATAYEIVPGLAAGADIQYGQYLQKADPSVGWHAGAGYRFLNGALTAGFQVGKTTSDNQGTHVDTWLSIYHYQQIDPTFGVVGVRDQTEDRITNTDTNFSDQTTIRTQMLFSPAEAVLAGCVLTYGLSETKFSRRFRRETTRVYSSGTPDPANDFTTVTTSSREEHYDTTGKSWGVSPFVQWQLSLNDSIQADLGFLYAYTGGTWEQQETWNRTAEQTTYGDGRQIPVVTPPTVGERLVTQGTENEVAAKVAGVVGSREKGWLAGFQAWLAGSGYSQSGLYWSAPHYALGGEYWLSPEWALRLGSKIGRTNIGLTWGLGWDGGNVKADLYYYRESITFDPADNQILAAGLSMVL